MCTTDGAMPLQNPMRLFLVFLRLRPFLRDCEPNPGKLFAIPILQCLAGHRFPAVCILLFLCGYEWFNHEREDVPPVCSAKSAGRMVDLPITVLKDG